MDEIPQVAASTASRSIEYGRRLDLGVFTEAMPTWNTSEEYFDDRQRREDQEGEELVADALRRLKCVDCGVYGHEGGSEQCERYTDAEGTRQGATGTCSGHDSYYTTDRPKTSVTIPATPARVNPSPTGVDEPEDVQVPGRPGSFLRPKCRAGVVLLMLLARLQSGQDEKIPLCRRWRNS